MRKTKSAMLEATQKNRQGAAGVMEKTMLREFDRLCLPPVEPLSPGKSRKIREQSRISQTEIAALLNTGASIGYRIDTVGRQCDASVGRYWLAKASG